MSEKYTRADLRHIAEYMINELRECEDGTVTTTAKLAIDQGYNDLAPDDLLVRRGERRLPDRRRERAVRAGRGRDAGRRLRDVRPQRPSRGIHLERHGQRLLEHLRRQLDD